MAASIRWAAMASETRGMASCNASLAMRVLWAISEQRSSAYLIDRIGGRIVISNLA
jgi:hypothetical protein